MLREFICRDHFGNEWKLAIARQSDDGRWHCQAHLIRRADDADDAEGPPAESAKIFHADTKSALVAQIAATFPEAAGQVTFREAETCAE